MTLWLSDAPLVLASRSVSRANLLAAAGIPIEVLPADIDERGIELRAASRDARAAALLLAVEKARVIAEQRPGRLVLGADQTLALDARRFSKPPDRAAAVEQLQSLRGRTHALNSAVAVMRDGDVLFEHVETARLTMRKFSDEFLQEYLERVGDAALTSVGGYQLETLGVLLFERIEGDYFTILGLPLMSVLGFLRRDGCLAD
jgi:septum formation protein